MLNNNQDLTPTTLKHLILVLVYITKILNPNIKPYSVIQRHLRFHSLNFYGAFDLEKNNQTNNLIT